MHVTLGVRFFYDDAQLSTAEYKTVWYTCKYNCLASLACNNYGPVSVNDMQTSPPQKWLNWVFGSKSYAMF